MMPRRKAMSALYLDDEYEVLEDIWPDMPIDDEDFGLDKDEN